MRVDRIRATDFMQYRELDLELPARGIVIVTGTNGEGKSSLKEAVPVSVWGRTIRGRGQSGATFWTPGKPCSVETLIDGTLAVERKVTAKGAKSLRWQRIGAVSPEHPTSSKAKAQLEDYVPPFDVWRRTCVFSSHDAALFSTATDQVRKQLLEHLLGVDRFERALTRCRTDLAAARSDEMEAAGKVGLLSGRIEEKRKRLVDAGQVVPEIDASTEWFLLRRIESEVPGLVQLVEELSPAHFPDPAAELRGRLRAQEERFRKIELGQCPTCGQDVDSKSIEAARAEIDGARRELVALQARANETRERMAAAIGRLRVELGRRNARANNLRKFVAGVEALEVAVENASRAIEQVSAEIAEAEGELEENEAALLKASRSRIVLSTVEKVLGLRGVRAHVLGDALAGLEAVANVRLSRMFAREVGMHLRPYSEKKDGGVTDAISIELVGIGDGTYDSASDGERRRIDISILLGLADLADAAASRERGTVWFDEAFDALDSDGVVSVSEILVDMGKVRPVVVISHNEALVSNLRPYAELRLHVHGHVVRTRAA